MILRGQKYKISFRHQNFFLKNVFHFLQFLLKPVFVEKTGDGETEWEGYPNAQDTDAARKTERIAQRQTDDEVGNEGIGHHRFHAGNTLSALAKVYCRPSPNW